MPQRCDICSAHIIHDSAEVRREQKRRGVYSKERYALAATMRVRLRRVDVARASAQHECRARDDGAENERCARRVTRWIDERGYERCSIVMLQRYRCYCCHDELMPRADAADYADY